MFECINCKLNYKDLNNKLCVFCDICESNNKNYIFNILIGTSNLSQIEIIKRTYEYFNKYDKIPMPSEIDNNSQIFKINPYIFREFIKTNLILINYKIFFTNCIDLNKIKTKRFPLKYNQEKLNLLFLDNRIEISELDIDVFNSYNKFKDEYYLKNV